LKDYPNETDRNWSCEICDGLYMDKEVKKNPEWRRDYRFLVKTRREQKKKDRRGVNWSFAYRSPS
jgi:hypothetical protein